MTRFARAKGSKASNEKLPETATSWSEVKEQMQQKLLQQEEHKLRKQAETKRTANYRKFLQEHDAEQLKHSKWADFPTATKRGKSTENPTSKRETNVVEGESVKKKVKQRIALDKAKTKEKVADVKVKKPLEEMTPEERTKCERKMEKRRRQTEKRKLQKAASGRASKKAAIAKPIAKNRRNTEHKRRKPQEEGENALKMFLNGKEIELVYFDGYPIKKEDAERLKALKKAMISKGVPRREVAITMKLQRRRAEKALAREKKNVCFKCRRAGHFLSECPLLEAEDDAANVETTSSGICFKCGSTEHTSFVCKVVKGNEFRFAACFICKQQGHISWQCPDNARGMYPKGGACNVCGSVTHLKKDCPQHMAQKENDAIALETIANDTNPDSLTETRTKSSTGTQRRINKRVTF